RHPPGLVGERDVDVGAPRERLEQAPLHRSQVLEAVREDGLAVPGVELAAQALDRPPAERVPVAEAEPVELGAVGRVEGGEVAVEVARLDEARLELAEGGQERVDEAGEAGRARALEAARAQRLV